MELSDFGKTKDIQNRRLAVITLEEKGLKPREIGKSLQKAGVDITMQQVYSDIKWGLKTLTRERREEIWDNQFMKELEKNLQECNHGTQRVGILKLILSTRQDMRKRAGLYIERVRHEGEVEHKVDTTAVFDKIEKYRKELEKE